MCWRAFASAHRSYGIASVKFGCSKKDAKKSPPLCFKFSMILMLVRWLSQYFVCYGCCGGCCWSTKHPFIFRTVFGAQFPLQCYQIVVWNVGKSTLLYINGAISQQQRFYSDTRDGYQWVMRNAFGYSSGFVHHTVSAYQRKWKNMIRSFVAMATTAAVAAILLFTFNIHLFRSTSADTHITLTPTFILLFFFSFGLSFFPEVSVAGATIRRITINKVLCFPLWCFRREIPKWNKYAP